jgi:hypothetical protein
MTTWRTIWPVVLLTTVVVPLGVSGEEPDRTNQTVRITVIKHCLQPFASFEIVGTEVRGIRKLKDLTKVLRNHAEKNPEARYEVLAEVKATPEGEKAIVNAIRKAGITIEHYWAARSTLPPKGTPVGPHGIGFVDHIERYDSSR